MTIPCYFVNNQNPKNTEIAMTHQQSNNSVALVKQALLDDRDFLKIMVEETLQKILDNEFNSFLGASPYQRTDRRNGYRNGTYNRTVYTRVGPLELQVPRDRQGLFSTALFGRYQRSEKALMLAMVEMVIQGVSTAKVRKITDQLCGTTVSASTVSRLTTELDAELAIWRRRPLSACPYLVVDARYENVRHEGRVVSMAVLIAYGITAAGHRSILDVAVSHSENEADYRAFFTGLHERGLTGVELITSDDHTGLSQAITSCFPGASWQRCQVHFLRNLIKRLRKRDRSQILTQMRDVFAAADKKTAFQRLEALVDCLRKPYPELAEWLEEDGPETLRVFDFPSEQQIRLRTTNGIERLNQEIKRRTRVIRIFPNPASCLRLITALCQEQSEVWESGRRYMIMPREAGEMEVSKVG